MKISYIFILIICVLNSQNLINFVNSKRIIHFGVDGVLQKCLKQSKHTVFDLFENSCSYTYKARTAIQTMSAPGWSNILCGIDSELSGIVNNNWIAPWGFEQGNPITPFTGNDKPFPCIFQHLKEKDDKLKTGYFVDWDWFLNLSNSSIPEGRIDYDIYCDGPTGDGLKDMTRCDSVNVNKVKEHIKNKDFDYLFLYLGQVDEQGHATGFCSDEYIQRLTVVNNLIESIIVDLKNEGIYDDTYLIWNTDHGATFKTTHHGDQIDDNLLVPFFVCGPDIKPNHEITSNKKNTSQIKSSLPSPLFYTLSTVSSLMSQHLMPQ